MGVTTKNTQAQRGPQSEARRPQYPQSFGQRNVEGGFLRLYTITSSFLGLGSDSTQTTRLPLWEGIGG